MEKNSYDTVAEKRTWTEVVQKRLSNTQFEREDATDGGRWKKLVKIG